MIGKASPELHNVFISNAEPRPNFGDGKAIFNRALHNDHSPPAAYGAKKTSYPPPPLTKPGVLKI